MFINRTSFPGIQQGRRAGGMCSAYKLLLCFFFLCQGMTVLAQKADSSDKMRINILKNRVVIYTKTDTAILYRFIGDVIIQQGSDTLYCDSLYKNETTGILESFSNVRVAQQDGTQATCDYLRYTSNKKLAFMQGNVTLTDGRNHLKCEELTYNLDTKTGVYDKWGTLSNDTTRITSRTGVYDVRNKEAHFKDNVTITDPQYDIKSEDIMYNTESKITNFYAKSEVRSDSGRSLLVTSLGTYDGKNVIAHFIGYSYIWNDGQYIQADSFMRYNKVTGYGFADGNVVSIDTERHSTLYCGHMEYLRKQRALWATIKPVMEQVNGKDTLYMRADTFYSAPMVKQQIKAPVKARPRISDTAFVNTTVVDSVAANKIATDTAKAARTKPAGSAPENIAWVVPENKFRMPDFQYDTVKTITQLYKKTKKSKAKDDEAMHTVVPDTATADTTAPLYFVGFRHVRIFSDSLQGRCDSVCYTRSDSTIRLISAPVVWSHNSQITGDTILLHMDSSTLRSMYVPNNAFLVSQSGPVTAGLFDQIQGKTLTAYFINNEITLMNVYPMSESIYYSKDDSGAYIGVNQSKSDRMRVYFDNQKIISIKFDQDVHQTVTPMDKADLPNTKLSKFKWLKEQRPKSKEELFR